MTYAYAKSTRSHDLAHVSFIESQILCIIFACIETRSGNVNIRT